MTDPLHVTADERETIRVFALDLPESDTEALTANPPSNGSPPPLADLFGLVTLDATYVEIFPASDLKAIGLSGYVTEGLGVDPADLAGEAGKLDAETGMIAILHARAFGASEVTLDPKPTVRLLGTYRLAQTGAPTLTRSDTTGGVSVSPPPGPRPDLPARLPRSLALMGLLAAAVIALIASYLIGGRGP